MLPGHLRLVGGDPGVDPELAGGIVNLIWPGNTSGSPRRSWKVLLEIIDGLFTCCLNKSCMTLN